MELLKWLFRRCSVKLLSLHSSCNGLSNNSSRSVIFHKIDYHFDNLTLKTDFKPTYSLVEHTNKKQLETRLLLAHSFDELKQYQTRIALIMRVRDIAQFLTRFLHLSRVFQSHNELTR